MLQEKKRHLSFVGAIALRWFMQKEGVKNLRHDTAPGLFTLNFEVEHLLLPGSRNADNIPTYEQILSMPFADKNKINVTVYEDGTSAWRIEKTTPVIDLTVQHETPPGTEPKAVTTVIDRAGMGYYYGKNNKLLFQQMADMPSFLPFVNDIDERVSSLSMMGVLGAEHLKTLLAHIQAKGAVLQHLDNGIVSVRTEAEKPVSPAYRTDETSSSYTTVQLFNEDLGLYLGGTVYDGQTILCQTFYSYTLNGQQQLVPYIIHTETWSSNPQTGERIKSASETYFTNVSVTSTN